MKKLKKTLWLSLQFILVITLGGLIYGAIVHRHFTVRYLFLANFLVGAIVILIGLIMLLVPVRPKGKLIDHSTYADALMELREQKRKKAHDMLYLGMRIILIPAVLQVLLALVL